MAKQPLTDDLHQLHTDCSGESRSSPRALGDGFAFDPDGITVKVWREHVKSHASSSSVAGLSWLFLARSLCPGQPVWPKRRSFVGEERMGRREVRVSDMRVL